MNLGQMSGCIMSYNHHPIFQYTVILRIRSDTLDTQSSCESTSLTLIQRRNNVVCPVGTQPRLSVSVRVETILDIF